MEGDVISLTQGIALDLWARAEIFLRSLMRPWNGYQAGIALGFFVVAHLLNRLSVWMLVQAIIVIGALFALALRPTTSAARVRRNVDISPSMQVLVVKLLKVLLYGTAFFIGLRAVGVHLTGLAVLSGRGRSAWALTLACRRWCRTLSRG